jgi:ATP-dependent Clp protease adaptor protein ClpS
MSDAAWREPGRHDGTSADCHNGTIVGVGPETHHLEAVLDPMRRRQNVTMPATTAPVREVESHTDHSVAPDRPWIVLVWNDPINLMSYVTMVLQKVFGYSLEKATSLMLDVHHKGRAVVSNGTREKAEIDVFRLHEHGLWATMQQDD